MAKFSKRLIGIILSVCMLMSLFTCLSGLSAGAVASDKMFAVTAVGKYPAAGYLSANPVLVAGKSYTFTCKFVAPEAPNAFDFSDDSANLRNMFGFWGANSENDNNAFWWRMTNHTISYDAETKTVTARLTASNDSNGTAMGPYAKIVIGDRNGNFRGWGTFYFADPTFVCDDDPSIDLLADCPIDEAHYVADGSDSTLAQHKGVWVSYDDYATPEMPVIVSMDEAFAAEPVYSTDSTDMLHLKEATARWRPKNGSVNLKASTDYRVSLYWENINSAPVDGDNDDKNNFFYAKYYNGSNWAVLFKANNTSSGVGCTVTKTPVAHGEKVDIDFTTNSSIAAAAGGANIFFLIGDYNGHFKNEEFKVAHIKVYERDGDTLTDLEYPDLCANTTLGNVSDLSTDCPSTANKIIYRNAKDRTNIAELLTIPDGYFDVSTATPQMANVYYGYAWNIFAYKDENLTLASGETYTLTMNQRITSGTPTVDVYSVNDTGSNFNGSDAYTDSYSDATPTGTTRTITFRMKETVHGILIRMGNYSESKNVSASFGNVSLKQSGSDTELIADIKSNNIASGGASESIGSKNRFWYRIKPQDGNYTPIQDFTDIPDGYFEGTEQANVFYLEMDRDGSTGYGTSYGGLDKSVMLEPSTTYYFECNYRAYAGAYPKVEIYAYGGDKGFVQTPLSNNTMNGSVVSSLVSQDVDNDTWYLLPADVQYGAYGHYAVSFTTPDSMSGAHVNVKIRCGAYIKNNDSFHYARGGLYFGNFKLRKSTDAQTVNIILNGDLSIAKPGNVSHESTTIKGFFVNVADDKCVARRVLPKPEDFFSLRDCSEPQKVLKFNGGNWDYIQQNLFLESNTSYRLSYKVSYINGRGTCGIVTIGDDNNSVATTEISGYYNESTSTFTRTFTTAGNLRTVYNNANFRIVIPDHGSDVSLYISDVKLNKISGSTIVGPNLINNGGFYFGDSEKITNVADLMDENGRIPGKLQFNGWYAAPGATNFAENDSMEFVAYAEEVFPRVNTNFSERLLRIRNGIIGIIAANPANPYEDVDQSGEVNIIDYIKTKIAAVESNSENSVNLAVDVKEREFLASYVNGNNATDISALQNANMLATPVTGNTYYVSSSTGNDSRDGKTPETAWKTLSKAMSVTASGSAVLFKCGDTWRRGNSKNAVLTTNAGVTYGSYGSGAKPQILGSVYNYASRTWTKDSGNIWKTSIKNYDSSAHSYDDVGIIVFDGTIGNMKATKDELSKNGDFWNHNWNGEEGGDGYVYVYSDTNPASKWSDIEIGQKRSVIVLSGNNVTINNLCVRYGGEHGISGGANVNVAISNCEVNYIGGAYNSGCRLGNGIQFASGGSTLRVKNCYITNCFDCGVTFQSYVKGQVVNWSSINFSNNLITDCFMGIEWWADGRTDAESEANAPIPDTISNVYFNNNIIRNIGGWSYDERIGDPSKIGTYYCASIKVGQRRYFSNLSDFYIYNNTFDRAEGPLILWWWDERGTAAADKREQSGLHVYNNNYYQDKVDDIGGHGNRLICFGDEAAICGESTGALRYAITTTDNGRQAFDSNPGEICYLVQDARVIRTL